MRPLTLLLVGLGVMWFITSGRAGHVWQVLTGTATTSAPGALPPPVPGPVQ